MQSALLEAMQERQVTIGDSGYILEEPSWCWLRKTRSNRKSTTRAEAPQDGFLMKVIVTYPSKQEEQLIIRNHLKVSNRRISNRLFPCMKCSKERNLTRQIYMDEKLENYILDIVFATRILRNTGWKKLNP